MTAASVDRESFPTRFAREVWRLGRPLLPFVAVFLLLDLGWATLVNFLAGAVHVQSHAASHPGQADAVDAVWHLATGLLVAIPARDRRLYLLAPALSLGLDVDHVFGLVVPAAVSRPSHTLLFVALAVVVALAWKGRWMAFGVGGAVLTHLAVDGGSLPLLAPVVFSRWTLSPVVEGVLVVFAGGLFLLALGRHDKRIRDPRAWVELGIIAVLLAIFLALVGPLTWYSLLSG